MKHAAAIFFIFFAMSSYAQNWCPPGATWTYDNIDPWLWLSDYAELRYTGDTVILGKQVKVLTEFQQPGNYDNPFFLGPFYTYEDSGIVYILTNNSFDTLYNFNAVPGDTWRLRPLDYYCNDTNAYVLVIDTMTASINGAHLKSLAVEYHSDAAILSHYNDTIIEKIGRTKFYLTVEGSICGFFDWTDGGPLRCYWDDSSSVYKTGHRPTCDYSVGINVNEINAKLNITLLPNPATSASTLTIHQTQYRSGRQLQLFNLTGQKAMDILLEQEKQSINISTLPQGLYIFFITNNQGVIKRGKILVQ